MNLLKVFIKSAVHKIGFDLHRLTPSSNPAFQLLKALNHFDIDLVLDVGANVGQFALELRSVGYKVYPRQFRATLSRSHDLVRGGRP